MDITIRGCYEKPTTISTSQCTDTIDEDDVERAKTALGIDFPVPYMLDMNGQTCYCFTSFCEDDEPR